jgi:hypothetical protein
MLLERLYLRFALRQPTKSHLSLSSQQGSNDSQYTNTWLNQCLLLNAHKTIAEQVSFKLSNAASTKRHSGSSVPYLEIPHVSAQILPDLQHDITFFFQERSTFQVVGQRGLFATSAEARAVVLAVLVSGHP